jgi:hypothetical protein
LGAAYFLVHHIRAIEYNAELSNHHSGDKEQEQKKKTDGKKTTFSEKVTSLGINRATKELVDETMQVADTKTQDGGNPDKRKVKLTTAQKEEIEKESYKPSDDSGAKLTSTQKILQQRADRSGKDPFQRG